MKQVQYEYKLTILTPTYNRRNTLPRLYDSLKRQSVQDFQWLLIDDGSSDGTEEQVASFSGHKFAIRYIKKQNGGKHTALNFSHRYIKGEWTCIVDSDDWLAYDAVFEMLSAIKRYEQYDKVKCITFLRGKTDGSPLVPNFPGTPVVSNIIQFRYNEHRSGDCCEIINTDVLKEFPFPVHNNERFLGEGYLWCRVGFYYDTVFINKIIYYCEYLEGGLTKSGRKMRISCPLGGMDNCNSFFLNSNGRMIEANLLRKKAVLFVCYGKFAHLSRRQIIAQSNNPKVIKRYYIMGVILYIFFRMRFIHNL